MGNCLPGAGGSAGPSARDRPSSHSHPDPRFERQREGEGEKVGPIIGVHSLSTDTSIKVYEGRTQYDMWKFVLQEEGPASRTGGEVDRRGLREHSLRARTGTPDY